MIAITQAEAEQLVVDSLVLQEAIGAGLLDADTAAQLQLGINPEPWFAEHPSDEEQERFIGIYRVTFSPDAVDPAGCLSAAPGVHHVEFLKEVEEA